MIKTLKKLRARTRYLIDRAFAREFAGQLLLLFVLVVSIAKDRGTVDDAEYYKTIMRGEIPLISEDEGLEAIDLVTGSDRIVRLF